MADWLRVISIPGGDAFVCPQCGSELTVEGSHASKDDGSNSEGKRWKTLAIVSAIIFLILLAGIAGSLVWEKYHGMKAAGANTDQNTILRLAGSNTIGEALGPALAEAYLRNEAATEVRTLPGANPQEKIVQGILPNDSSPSFITIAAHGSATAFTTLASGKCDIGMASRRIKPDEASKLSSLGDMTSIASEHILGLDGIAVIVNVSNPIDQLDKDQIMQIFTGATTDWSKVGPYHGTIKVYARNDNSGTYDTFKSLVLAGKALAPGAQRIEDSKDLSNAVANDPNGIGFIGLPYILSAKAIAVSEKGTVALLPTRLSVATEDYLLSRRLYLYTASNPQNKYVREFVEFALSRRGQDVVGANGFVEQNVSQVAQTVPAKAPEEYKRLTFDANRLTLDFRFQSGQTVLDNKARADLDRVVSLIADLKITGDRVMLFGFSDNIGNPEMNRKLSLARAKAIADEFALRDLTPAIVRGYGSDLGVASNETEDGKAKNRRVEIWIKR
jgi:phosphate transport system substrate-binding protein